MSSQYRFHQDGFAAGVEAAEANIGDRESREALLKHIKEDRVGEFAGGIREHQAQFEGDISYEVDGNVTERQFELWEEGFYRGFEKTVMDWHKKRRSTRER